MTQKTILSFAQQQEIISRVANKETKASLAREFGVSARTIGRICAAVDESPMEIVELKELPKVVDDEISSNIKSELMRIQLISRFHEIKESKLVRRTPKRTLVADYSKKRAREQQIRERKNKKVMPKVTGSLGTVMIEAGIV